MVASAVEYYGHSQEENLTEDSELGSGYLSDVCSAGKNPLNLRLMQASRTIWLRTGIVLSGIGGALGKMLLPSECRWSSGLRQTMDAMDFNG